VGGLTCANREREKITVKIAAVIIFMFYFVVSEN
jgi:hypothetical protein